MSGSIFTLTMAKFVGEAAFKVVKGAYRVDLVPEAVWYVSSTPMRGRAGGLLLVLS